MSILRERFFTELEMAASDYVVAMTGMGDTEDNLRVFASAVWEIDRCLEKVDAPEQPMLTEPKRACFSWEAASMEREAVDISAAEGRISAEYVWAYPPGIPLLIPGERIEADFEKLIEIREQSGIAMKSTFSALPQKIYVLKEH